MDQVKEIGLVRVKAVHVQVQVFIFHIPLKT